MYIKFKMELVWHNCKTYPPKEFSNNNLIVTDGRNVFEMSWSKNDGYHIMDGLSFRTLGDLEHWWWADIEQTVQYEEKFR